MITPRVELLSTVADVDAELERLDCDRPGRAIMAPKGVLRVIRVNGIDVRAANILKQEFLAKGGECALPRGVYDLAPGDKTNALILATERAIVDVLRVLPAQPYGLKALGVALTESLRHAEREPSAWHCADVNLGLGARPRIMGVLNVTPDSFSDGGTFFEAGKPSADKAVEAARKMVADGADLLDIGGESTRPGSEPVSEDEEIARVVPLVEQLARDAAVGVPISVDTRKPEVAARAIAAGARVVNDIGGFRDPEMVAAVAGSGVGLVVMHMLGEPKTMQEEPHYEDLVGDVYAWLDQRARELMEAGIDRGRIAVDPGIGFGKTYAHNLELLARLGEFRSLGLPILVGPSRKRFIGAVLGIEEPADRLEGTAAAVAVAVERGARVLRVHDVKEMARVARMAEALRTGVVGE